MLKTKVKVGLALLATAASALSGCGKKRNAGSVLFWSSFGTMYSNQLEKVVTGVQNATGVEIDHQPQGSYDQIYKNMLSVTKDTEYPNLAIGYPDHFASYLGSDILQPLNEYFTQAELNDYYDFYLKENVFYDNGGSKAQERLYGIPFNKSTELMGYNGVFVDYCAAQSGYEDLAEVPKTWQEWAEKGPRYNTIFRGLIGKGVFGRQDVFGTASDFEVLPYDRGYAGTVTDDDGEVALPNGKKLLLDMGRVNSDKAFVLGWDATDNAFITLVRQWNAKYTEVAESEKTKYAKRRVGSVLFNSSDNKTKVANMLMFFRNLHNDGLFTTPKFIEGDYCSTAFADCAVMFMICSSGGLVYNTANWHHRFRVAPIPYNAETGLKTVISQGANITMTTVGEYENAAKVMKAFTTGEWQAEWCMATGYYPCSKSATNSEKYQNFIHQADKKDGSGNWVPITDPTEAKNSGAYRAPLAVAYREGSKLNEEHYMNESLGWEKFVDPAFEGSSKLRGVVKKILDTILSIPVAKKDDINEYYAKLNSVKDDPDISSVSTIEWL